jgi:Ino eighty subunit 1
MSSRRPSPTPKRPLVLKRADGEPLTRADIQYDVLHAIFSDTTPAFTNPYVGEPHEYTKVSFRELYIQAILNSSKATKSFKEKIMDSPDFARDFAMLALLVNVGRINTSMSCECTDYYCTQAERLTGSREVFAETKTPKCTYHPIPSLQRTGGNLQDGARIRHVLKAGLLNNETPLPPHIPDEIFARAVSFVGYSV